MFKHFLYVEVRRSTPSIVRTKVVSINAEPKMCHKLGELGSYTIGAKIITHTTFIVGELILQLHTRQLHS